MNLISCLKENLQGPKKFFSIFLIINALLWVIIELFRNVIGRDAMEAVIWGNLFSLGTNKHPPLSGWFASSFYSIFQENNVGIYILGQICIVLALIYIYKLAKNFFDENKAIACALVMTPCMYYTYQLFYDSYNCNYLSIPLWVMLVYYYQKALKVDSLKDWLILGVLSGLCFLAKYQVAFLLVAMFIYLLIYERRCFKNLKMYLALLIMGLISLPHVIWLFQNDFFSFIYLIGRTESMLADSQTITILQRLSFPFKFFLDQIASLAPVIFLYSVILIKEKKFSIRELTFKDKDLIFILLISLLPMLLIASMGFFTTSRIVGAWASTMVSFFGIMLFYLFPVEIKEGTYKLFRGFTVGLTVAWMIAMLIFVLLQNKIDMAFPYQKVMPEINAIWQKKTLNAPLKYVIGDYYYLFHYELYNPQKPKTILDTYGHKNPWIDLDDVKKSGVLIVLQNPDGAKYHLQALKEETLQDIDFKASKFEYEIKNAFESKKQKEFYYVIIPPLK